MRVGVIPENLGERIALALGVVPTPLANTLVGLLFARAIMAATELGIFDALDGDPLPADEVARRCDTDAAATRKILRTLVSADLLRVDGDCYRLAPMADKWLRSQSPRSLRDSILFSFVEMEILGHLEEYVRTGTALDVHRLDVAPKVLGLYHRGMCSRAAVSAAEVARRTPVPRGARAMLDVGGSHGLYSTAICRRHPALRAVILELPAAIEHVAPLLAREGMEDRVTLRAGDVLTEDLGSEKYDLVFLSQIVHHFDADTNRELAGRIARALRPSGTMVIQEVIRTATPTAAGQMAGLLDLYFALTSKAGTWAFTEMAAWQTDAGLIPLKPRWLRTLPGVAQQSAIKPARPATS
jgi:predicted O-methyltransferase YrrM